MSETKLFAVTGKPVFHSRSPQLFNNLFLAIGIDAVYIRLAAASAEEAISTAKVIKLSGLNVTSPFKEEVIHFLDSVDKHALEINAVNCVINQKNKYTGYNTDFIGAVRALEKNGVELKNKKIVILGAGGAARAAAYGLIKSDTKNVTIMNRTSERAKRDSQSLGCDYAPLENAEKIMNKCDILISCIPSHSGIINPDLLKESLVIMDANYKDSSFIRNARAKGCITVSGLEWLYYQALPAFSLFTGQEILPDFQRSILKNALIEKLNNKSNIALIGFMGSGKTAVGRLLAERMRFGFVDIDKIIEKSSGVSIPEIFKKRGEKNFRKIERSVIAEQISQTKGKVFSLGGGAILSEENRKILKKYCRTVWLWVSVQTAIKRIDISSRPLLNHSNPEKAAERTLAARIPLYAKVSDLVINTETGCAGEIARRIKDEMDQALKD